MKERGHLSRRELGLPKLEFPRIESLIANDKSIISLGPGEPDFLTPKPLLEYARTILSKSTHYSEPQGVKELREAIARKLKKDNKIEVSSENIVVGSGSQELLFSALLTTLDPGQKAIVQSPGYLGYLPAIRLVNASPVFLRLEESDDFEINPDRLKKLIDKKTRIIILNSPNNPTGNVVSKKVLEEVADIAIDKDVFVFSDEAYEKIIYDGVKHVSMGSLNGMEDHVLTFQTFSKSYAMCGFRVGYVAGPKELVSALNKSHHYVSISAPSLSQLIGVKALSLNKRYIENMVKEYKRRRDMIVKRLNDLDLQTCMPKGAFYAFSNIQKYGKNSVKFSDMLVKKAKVAVVPGTEFGPHGEGYIRCSFATDYKLIEKAMDRIEKVLIK